MFRNVKCALLGIVIIGLTGIPAEGDSPRQDITNVSKTYGVNSPDCGDESTPCQTINYGISRALSEGHSEVHVDMGTYIETVVMADGVSLIGGYDAAADWTYHVSNSTIIIGGTIRGHKKTIIAENILTPTLIKWFQGPSGGIIGEDNNDPQGNSYAIYVVNSPGLEIVENDIAAGNAGPGVNGADGENGQNGTNGGGGSSDPSYTAYETASHPCSESRQHNDGGVLICSESNVSGGNGGGNICPVGSGSGVAGATGNGPGGGVGGQGGSDGDIIFVGTCDTPAGDGSHGADGQHGDDGLGGSSTDNGDGTVEGMNWIGYPGGAGQDGSHGSGGGGGGAGGGVEGISPTYNDWLGGHGGGGGSGACGGEAGSGGLAGGGSFGIYIVTGGAPTIEFNSIKLGNGGDGGDGGIGGYGGDGGMGGQGGGCDGFCECAGSGGSGGNGGHGGHGGGGGGGAGGISYGIYAWGLTSGIDLCDVAHLNSFEPALPAPGGTGGASAGSPGGNGHDGAVGECIVLNSDIIIVCGDANGDFAVNVGDAVYLINYAFKGGPAPNPLEAGDANCDAAVNVGDAVYLINFSFKGGPAPCADCP